MSCIHYKFKSRKDYDTLTFDGVNISIADLKKEIIQQKKLGKLMENFDLQILNGQTSEAYKNEDILPKNSSVVVARVPLERPNKTRQWENRITDAAHLAYKAANEGISSEMLKKSANLVAMKATEEEKIKAMMEQSSNDYDQSNFLKMRSHPTGPPPRTYVCYGCNQPGHYIHNCPNPKKQDMSEFRRLPRSTGIPNSFMTLVSANDQPGVMVDSKGQMVVNKIHELAYKQGKKEKPPFVKSDSPEPKVEDESKKIPAELLCSLCQNLLVDAVLIPCCGNSFCDDCIRTKILESPDHTCPECQTPNQSPDSLVPNKYLRQHVTSYLNESSYINTKKTASDQSSQNIVKQESIDSKQRPELSSQPHAVHMAKQEADHIRSDSRSPPPPPPPPQSSAHNHHYQAQQSLVSRSAGGRAVTDHSRYQPRSGVHGGGIGQNIGMHQAPSSVVFQSQVAGINVGQSHSAPNLLSQSLPNDNQEPRQPAIQQVIYVDQHGTVLDPQQVASLHQRQRLAAPSVAHLQQVQAPNQLSSHSHSMQPRHEVMPPSVEPRYLPMPPGVDMNQYPPLGVNMVNNAGVHSQPPGMSMLQSRAAMHMPLYPPGSRPVIARPLTGPPPSYRPLSGSLRGAMPSDSLVPSLPSSLYPPAAAMMHLAPRPPLSEEEFYRLQELERKRNLEKSINKNSDRNSVMMAEFQKKLMEPRKNPRPVVTRSRSRSPIRQMASSPGRAASRSRTPSPSNSQMKLRGPQSPPPRNWVPKRSASPEMRTLTVAGRGRSRSRSKTPKMSGSPVRNWVPRRSVSPRTPPVAGRGRSRSRSATSPAHGPRRSLTPQPRVTKASPVRTFSPVRRSPLRRSRSLLACRSASPGQRRSRSRSFTPMSQRSGSAQRRLRKSPRRSVTPRRSISPLQHRTAPRSMSPAQQRMRIMSPHRTVSPPQRSQRISPRNSMTPPIQRSRDSITPPKQRARMSSITPPPERARMPSPRRQSSPPPHLRKRLSPPRSLTPVHLRNRVSPPINLSRRSKTPPVPLQRVRSPSNCSVSPSRKLRAPPRCTDTSPLQRLPSPKVRQSSSPPLRAKIAPTARKSLSPLSSPESRSGGMSRSRSPTPVSRPVVQKQQVIPKITARPHRSPTPVKHRKLSAAPTTARRSSKSVSRSPPRTYKPRPVSRSPSASRKHKIRSRSPLGAKRPRRNSPHSPGRRAHRNWSPEAMALHRFRDAHRMPTSHPSRAPIPPHPSDRFRFGPGSPSRLNDPFHHPPEATDPRWMEYMRALNEWYEHMKMSIPHSGTEPVRPRSPPGFSRQRSPKQHAKRSRSRSRTAEPKKHSSKSRMRSKEEKRLRSKDRGSVGSKSHDSESRRHERERTEEDLRKKHVYAKLTAMKTEKTESSKKIKSKHPIENVEEKRSHKDKRSAKESMREPRKLVHLERESTKTVSSDALIAKNDSRRPKHGHLEKESTKTVSDDAHVHRNESHRSKPRAQSKHDSVNSSSSSKSSKAAVDLSKRSRKDSDTRSSSSKEISWKPAVDRSHQNVVAAGVQDVAEKPSVRELATVYENNAMETIASPDPSDVNATIADSRDEPTEAVVETEVMLPEEAPVLPARLSPKVETPVLVASIPERSKWERDTDSDLERKMRSKDKIRSTAAKNILPRSSAVSSMNDMVHSKPVRSSVSAVDRANMSGSAPLVERKASAINEEEFEPDYDETETSEMEQTANERTAQDSAHHRDSTDKKHKSSHRHRHKPLRQSLDEETDSKAKKHKKHSKKLKKHKSKSKK